MTDFSDASLAELLQDDLWLRRFVASLVADHEVDDLVQQTWLAATQKPPRERSRAWLLRVARNFGRMHMRTKSRRREHEREAARRRPEALPSTEEARQRIAAQKLVAEAVGELPATYRDVVILRWYHDLAYSVIADRVNTSEANARQRAVRGLAMAREKLERELGSDWRAQPGIALLAAPLAKAKTTAGLVIAAAMVVSVLGVGGMFAFSGSATKSSPEFSLVDLDSETVAGSTEALQWEDAPTLAKPASRREAQRSPIEERRSGYAYRGTLRDPFARSIAGAKIALGDQPATVSDQDGRFELWVEERDEGTEIRVEGYEVVAFTRGPARSGEGVEAAILVAGQPLDLRIEVVMDGRRYPGVTGGARTHQDLSSFDLPIPPNVGWPLRDLEGHVEDGYLLIQEVIPGVDRVWLKADGFDQHEQAVPDSPLDPWRIEYLGRPSMVFQTFDDPDESQSGKSRWRETIGGRVIGADGGPLVGATVTYKGALATSGDDGSFSMVHRNFRYHDALTVTKEGLRPLILEGFSKRPEFLEPAEALVLRLDQEPLKISGRVVDVDGEPIEGLLVFPHEPRFETDFFSAEDLAAPDPAEGVPEWIHKRCIARTDALGRFELDGLYQPTYSLRVMDPDNCLSMVTAPMVVGVKDAQLEFKKPVASDPLEGRVVDSAGIGVPSANIHVERVFTFGKLETSRRHRRLLVQTDDDGRFGQRRVPGDREARIYVEAEGFLASSLPLGEFPNEPDSYVLYRPCSIRVILHEQPEQEDWGRAIEARDANGKMLPLMRGSTSWYFLDTRSVEPTVYLVSEEIREVVIKDMGEGDTVYRRIPVTVHPDRITEIHL